MGDGAANAFYQLNKSWLDSPEDAHEALYGRDKKNTKVLCPVCGKKFKTKRAMMMHIGDYHKNEKGKKALAELGEMPPADPPRKRGSLI